MGFRAAVLATVFFSVSACSTLAGDDELLDTREISVPADPLKDLELSHSVIGDTLLVTTRARGSHNGRIDLTINIPDRLNISIDDTSGSIRVERVQGHLDIQDRSGEVEVSEIRGVVTLDDQSGSISIREVRNNVTIEDSSGDISVAGIQGSVTIGDSSGSINVKDVEGDFIVRRDSSGSVDYSAVKGRISLAGRK